MEERNGGSKTNLFGIGGLFQGKNETPQEFDTLTKIEGGVAIKPSIQTMAKIAKALGVPMEKLVK
ncbi:MAG: helix-turn-helix transcriptional regulator [Patescibacteria group bacterium]|nr:helix-turn-helix transcriptional regulator [Patescibacteria group bacterium]